MIHRCTRCFAPLTTGSANRCDCPPPAAINNEPPPPLLRIGPGGDFARDIDGPEIDAAIDGLAAELRKPPEPPPGYEQSRASTLAEFVREQAEEIARELPPTTRERFWKHLAHLAAEKVCACCTRG